MILIVYFLACKIAHSGSDLSLRLSIGDCCLIVIAALFLGILTSMLLFHGKNIDFWRITFTHCWYLRHIIVRDVGARSAMERSCLSSFWWLVSGGGHVFSCFLGYGVHWWMVFGVVGLTWERWLASGAFTKGFKSKLIISNNNVALVLLMIAYDLRFADELTINLQSCCTSAESFLLTKETVLSINS